MFLFIYFLNSRYSKFWFLCLLDFWVLGLMFLILVYWKLYFLWHLWLLICISSSLSFFCVFLSAPTSGSSFSSCPCFCPHMFPCIYLYVYCESYCLHVQYACFRLFPCWYLYQFLLIKFVNIIMLWKSICLLFDFFLLFCFFMYNIYMFQITEQFLRLNKDNSNKYKSSF